MSCILKNQPLLFFNRSLLEYICFTIPCQFLLHNKVNRAYAYMCPHIPSLLSLPPILPIPPLQVIAKHRANLPVLMLLLPTSQLFYIWQCIYVDATLTSPQLRPPTPCHQVYSLCLPLYYCLATRFISTIFLKFRFHIYVLAQGICLSLSDLLHSV